MGELGIGGHILLLLDDIMKTTAVKTLLPVLICSIATDRYGTENNGAMGRPPDFIFPSMVEFSPFVRVG